MRAHVLQHVPFEGLGSMESTLKERGHTLTATHLYLCETLPPLDTFDLLIIMGGPMGIFDEGDYAWLKAEKPFIKAAMEAKKKLLGICLGAQLVAHVLGATITANPHREIGWFSIKTHPALETTRLKGIFPRKIEVFHWHGDTFTIPEGALPLASSEACPNQGFIMDNRIVALQFHLETTHHCATQLIEKGCHELDGSPFVQTEAEMLAPSHRFTTINRLMTSVLVALED